MKRVTTEQWIAFDGVPFPFDPATEAAAKASCRAYEKRLAHIRLVGLTIEQVEAALSRADPELADAIEVVGSRIARARLDAGEQKYEKRAAKDGPPARQITGPAASADIRADEGRGAADFPEPTDAEIKQMIAEGEAETTSRMRA